MSDITDKIFDKRDNPLLEYNDDDGVLVEPIFYVPSLPMLLINGSSGIGTGWSTEIPSYKPTDLISNIKLALQGKEMTPMTPYYRGFKGNISEETENGESFKTTGIYEEQGQKLIITELPIGTWTSVYKEHLEKLQNDDFIRYYNSYCTDVDVKFEVFWGEKLKKMYYSHREKFESKMKLTSIISCRNLVAFNSENKLTKYSSILEMLD